ncbi:hypothetical protein ACHAWF_013704 [Thalassiosira exigua]
MERLKEKANDGPSASLKDLKRCHALEKIAKTLIARLESLPMDTGGCVVYQVYYEHRDPSGRGRLFAIGENVKVDDDKYPRTATLQGMQSDLRMALVGKFGHDIDCENSEVRLICSLARQLNLENIIPSIFDYRDNRARWLSMIEDAFRVPTSDAKRLVNIILSGGRYETWLRSVGKKSSSSAPKEIKSFCFRLYAEIGALRGQLLQHPRFKWTEVDREKLLKEGRSKGSIDSLMMPRIVQICENDVLGLIHLSFHQNKWVVRAKVFDGLIAEPGPGAPLSLSEINRKSESVCQSFGWDIKLVEKPLHGKHVDAVASIVKARTAVHEMKSAAHCTRRIGIVTSRRI